MRIGIDCRMMNASGIGRYITNLLIELQELDKENEYFIFVLKKDFGDLKLNSNFKIIVADYYWYSITEQLKFPGLLTKYKLDLVHFPHFNTPVFYPGKYIVTIHDLTHLDFKMSRASAHNRIFYEVKHQSHKAVFKSAVLRSQKVITVSNFVKSELESRYKLKPEKLLVTYEGVDQNIIDLEKKITQNQKNEILKKYQIREPFIFYVGNAHPHKNLEGLIKVFSGLKKKNKNLKLVLSGKEDFFWNRLKKESQDENIVFTGHITDLELVAFYKTAEMFVFPSFSEGFGIPLVEAMYCGCPIVSSDKTALPEIAGEAALYFDPNDLNDLEEKILTLLEDKKLKEILIKKGYERVKMFSWKKMATQTLDVYNHL